MTRERKELVEKGEKRRRGHTTQRTGAGQTSDFVNRIFYDDK